MGSDEFFVPSRDYSKDSYSPKNLSNLVERLSVKGVHKEELVDVARDLGLRSCSYGSLSLAFPIMGVVFGSLIGAGSGLLCNDICERFYVDGADKFIANIVSMTIPWLFFVRSGFSVRSSQDYDFYYRIKEIFEDKLSS